MEDTTRAGEREVSRSQAATGQEAGLKDRIRQTASTQLNRQKDRATEGLGNLASAVRQSTERLRDRDQNTAARYVEQAANQLQRISDGLRHKSVGELVNDAQRLARRQPALFVGGAFVLGLLGARFLKSSAPESHGDYARDDRYGTVGTVGIGEYDRTIPVPHDVMTPSRDTSGGENL